MSNDTSDSSTEVASASDAAATEGVGGTPQDRPAPEPAGQVPFSPHEITNGDLEPDTGPEMPDTVQKARREAAHYRTELRSVEAERDTLRGWLETMQRAHVEELASSGAMLGFSTLKDGSDLWLADVKLPDLLDDGGQVDAEKVAAAVKRVIAERPHWRTPTPSLDGGVRGAVPPRQVTFADVLGDPRRG